jgi:hypothetical protein
MKKTEIRLGVSQLVVSVQFTFEYERPHLADPLNSMLYLLHTFLSGAFDAPWVCSGELVPSQVLQSL